MYINLAMLAAKGAAGAAILTSTVGKKIIEVGIPATQKASQISFTFIKGGIEAVKNQSSTREKIQLSENLEIINNDLSIPLSFMENQFKSFKIVVANDLNTIKGQNEMLFLSNSISYFVESHATRIGLDRSISYALQYDMAAVRNHLNKSRDIRFPGYLLHQCASLGETIKELNIFYTSILTHGKVPNFSKEEVKEELSKRYGASQRKGDIRSYIPYDLQLPLLRQFAEEKKKNTSKLCLIFGDNKDLNISEINDMAHEALYVLSEELIANEELEHKLFKKIKDFPEEKLYVESFFNENQELT